MSVPAKKAPAKKAPARKPTRPVPRPTRAVARAGGKSDPLDAKLLSPTGEAEERTEGDTAEFQKELAKRRRSREIDRRLRSEEAAAGWSPPQAGHERGFLSEMLAAPPPKDRYLVNGLQCVHHNVTLAAQYKTGKTTLGLTYLRALVDRQPFLGHETYLPNGGRVAWLNGEMDAWDLIDYARPLGIKHADRVALLNLRGRRLPLLNDHVAEWVVEWLRDQGAVVLVIDSWRRVCGWSGVDENNNFEVESLTSRIDQIKADAGVDSSLILVHTGRSEQAIGEERARGATAIDDWADARWLLTRSEADRFFRAEGRGVQVGEMALQFNPATNAIEAGQGNRIDAKLARLEEKLLKAVAENPGATTSDIAEAAGENRNKTGPVTRILTRLEAAGEVEHGDVITGRGKVWWLAGQKPDDGPGCRCPARPKGLKAIVR